MADLLLQNISDIEQARFWAKVDKRGPDECWPWLAAKRKDGHGYATASKRLRSSAQVALVISGLDQIGGAWALHSCDNPPCCNPAHLRWGSPADNVRDMLDRNRVCRPAGVSNPAAKLSEADVREIFSHRPIPEFRGAATPFAEKFGLNTRTVWAIWRGENWNTVTGLTPTRVRRTKD